MLLCPYNWAYVHIYGHKLTPHISYCQGSPPLHVCPASLPASFIAMGYDESDKADPTIKKIGGLKATGAFWFFKIIKNVAKAIEELFLAVKAVSGAL